MSHGRTLVQLLDHPRARQVLEHDLGECHQRVHHQPGCLGVASWPGFGHLGMEEAVSPPVRGS